MRGGRQRRRTTSCVTLAVSALQALAWCGHARADEGGAADEGGTSELAESGASDNAGWTLTFDDEFDESSIDFLQMAAPPEMG